VKVLITGAGGLVGRAAAQAALDAGHDAVAMVRPGSTDPALAVPLVRADLEDPDSLRAAVEGAEVVLHCAAVFSYDLDAAGLQRANADGTRALVEAAAAAGVRRVVVTSSSVTCGSSEGPEARDESGELTDGPDYFQSKLAQELAARAASARTGVELVLACPTVVIGGPDHKLVPSNAILVRYLLDPTRSTFPGGANVVGVRDVAAGLVLLAERGEPGQRYLLGGENWTWRLLHTALSELAGLPGPFLTLGTTAAYLAAGLSEAVAALTSTTPLATRAEALTTGRYHWYDDRRARALGYASRPTRDALSEALGWLSTSEHLPRFVREGLRLAPEVVRSRRLVPAVLP
jgi:dihydroflavonol-4-reductase